MATFLVEGYLGAAASGDLVARGIRAQQAAAVPAAGRRRVTHLQSIFVPSDQTCFGLFEAASAEDVVAACAASGIPCDRIAAAVVAYGSGFDDHEGEAQT